MRVSGAHIILFTYEENNCSYGQSIPINVFALPTADFSVTGPVCENESSLITYTGNASASANFIWDFDGGSIISGTGEGPYEVQWPGSGNKNISLVVVEDGCTSEMVSNTNIVEQPLDAPIINCNVTTNSIEFEWNEVTGASSYIVNLISGGPGVQNGRTYLVENLSAGDEVSIEVIAIGAGTCGNSAGQQSCTAADCPNDIVVDINPVADLCLDAFSGTSQLSVSVTGGNGNGVGTWTGRGISDALLGVFDPNISGLGTHIVRYIYQEDNCMYEENINFNVVSPPSAEFSIANQTCINSVISLEYLGTASTSANYQWDFDGGVATPGVGAGPHNIVWSTSGAKTISLVVIEDGCTSEIFSESVAISEAIEAPVLDCSASLSSVQFSWEEVVGAMGYEVNVLRGPMGRLMNNTYLVEGLTPGDEVVIEVTAMSDDPCGNVTSSSFSCIAEACAPISARLSGDATICEGDETRLIFDFQGEIGTFNVVIEDEDNNQITFSGIGDGHQEIVSPQKNSSYRLISASANLNMVCPVIVGGTANITVNPPLKAGVVGAPIVVCSGLDTLINLQEAISQITSGGRWEESSLIGSSGAAFDATEATFTPIAQMPGTYSFDYIVSDNGPCGEDLVTVIVELSSGPNADAGMDQELDCDFSPVTLNGGNSSTGNNISYNWSGPDGITSANDILNTEIPGTYRLTVMDLQSSCSSTDEVEVLLSDDIPSDLNYALVDPACAGDENGVLLIAGVVGGTAPYFYSLGGGVFNATTEYRALIPGTYSLIVQDAKGCEFETSFIINDPPVLAVDLGEDIEIEIGDSLTLDAQVNLPVEQVRWSPTSPLNCVGAECLKFPVKPNLSATYFVEVISDRGCKASDDIRVTINKERRVFFPTGFSPNGDNNNDLYLINAGSGVTQVNTFKIF